MVAGNCFFTDWEELDSASDLSFVSPVFRFPTSISGCIQPFPLALVICAGAAVAGGSRPFVEPRLPPAEAMRPEPPANYRPALIERTGVGHLLSHTFRIAVRNIERKPMQAFFTVAGLALATGILIVPNCFRDGLTEVLDFQWDVVQRQDLTIALVEPGGANTQYLFEHLPGLRWPNPCGPPSCESVSAIADAKPSRGCRRRGFIIGL
jgi:putative ABC transport system permease protein